MSSPKLVSVNTAKPESKEPEKWEGVECCRLKGGHVVMTVEGVARGKIAAVWHDANGTLCFGEFKVKMVEPVYFVEGNEDDLADAETETAH